MYTKQKEDIAEDAIASQLQSAGFLVAKPKFDERGADLLAFGHIHGGARFARIQSKYRQAQSSVKIPYHYAVGAFVCIVHLVPRKGQADDEAAVFYAFTAEEIRAWPNRNGVSVLSLPSFETARKRFASNLLKDKIQSIRELIAKADGTDEMIGLLDFSNPNNSGLLAII